MITKPIDSCPSCGTDLVGEPIPQELHAAFVPPYFFSLKKGLVNQNGLPCWECFVCKETWYRDPTKNDFDPENLYPNPTR